MFKCECCHQQIGAGIPSQTFPIETRQKIYPPRYSKKKGSTGQVLVDAGGTGYETVREIQVCPDCHTKLTDQTTSPDTKLIQHEVSPLPRGISEDYTQSKAA